MRPHSECTHAPNTAPLSISVSVQTEKSQTVPWDLRIGGSLTRYATKQYYSTRVAPNRFQFNLWLLPTQSRRCMPEIQECRRTQDRAPKSGLGQLRYRNTDPISSSTQQGSRARCWISRHQLLQISWSTSREGRHATHCLIGCYSKEPRQECRENLSSLL